MSNTTYVAVANANTTFKQPRQKTWMVLQLGNYGWGIALISTSFIEVQIKAKALLSLGSSINNVIISEIVPIDTALTPNV